MAAQEEGEKGWYSSPQEDAKETVLFLGDVTSSHDDPPVEIGASKGTAPEYERYMHSLDYSHACRLNNTCSVYYFSETRSDAAPFETLKGQISQEMAGQVCIIR